MMPKLPKPGRKPALPPIIRLPRVPILHRRKISEPDATAPPAPAWDTGQLPLFPTEGGETPPRAEGKASASPVFRSRRLQPPVARSYRSVTATPSFERPGHAD